MYLVMNVYESIRLPWHLVRHSLSGCENQRERERSKEREGERETCIAPSIHIPPYQALHLSISSFLSSSLRIFISLPLSPSLSFRYIHPSVDAHTHKLERIIVYMIRDIDSNWLESGFHSWFMFTREGEDKCEDEIWDQSSRMKNNNFLTFLLLSLLETQEWPSRGIKFRSNLYSVLKGFSFERNNQQSIVHVNLSVIKIKCHFEWLIDEEREMREREREQRRRLKVKRSNSWPVKCDGDWKRKKWKRERERELIQQACCTYVCFITSSDWLSPRPQFKTTWNH